MKAAMTFLVLVIEYIYVTSSCSTETCPRFYSFCFFLYEDCQDAAVNKLLFLKVTVFCIFVCQ
jgi:hypothetical protein